MLVYIENVEWFWFFAPIIIDFGKSKSGIISKLKRRQKKCIIRIENATFSAKFRVFRQPIQLNIALHCITQSRLLWNIVLPCPRDRIESTNKQFITKKHANKYSHKRAISSKLKNLNKFFAYQWFWFEVSFSNFPICVLFSAFFLVKQCYFPLQRFSRYFSIWIS